MQLSIGARTLALVRNRLRNTRGLRLFLVRSTLRACQRTEAELRAPAFRFRFYHVSPLSGIIPVLVLLCLELLPASAAEVLESDICIYGGTSAGVAAAVQAARMGKTVIMAEPGSHLGGMTSGGLGATDIGNKAAIGGISREFYHRIALYYSRDDAWRFESREAYFKNHSAPPAPPHIAPPD